MHQKSDTAKNMAGFSLVELLIAMTATLVMLGIATTALTTGYRIRDREESVTDAAADAQRALNIMSREIANAGFNLNTNGIVPGDSNATSIRIRSNLNKYDPSASEASQNGIIDPGEDIKYFVNTANNTDYLVRHDANATGNKTTVLANRVDQIRVHYFAQKATYSTADCDITGASTAEVSPSDARYVVLAVCVHVGASGSPNTAGYQPASNVLLVSDVTLRNSMLTNY
ncbi:MAG TPA: prepilin-type N-terminal cleavage/methylation domain-containing protein [Pyrinomonadaceae bacterium]|nr:prepilin-type N-terminal cleavage/methylation domain-containing protein [Pyrinomonadaceae bacterium]